MFERGKGFAPPSPRRADKSEVDGGPERSPAQVVEAKFTEAEETLKAITAVGIPKLAAAQLFTGDRRSPRQRRTEYDLAKEGIESQFKSAETAKTTAIEHAKRHGVDTAALVKELDEEVTKAKEQLREAPTAPPGFLRVPGEDAILAAIRMPPGKERNTELIFLVSELDRRSARALRGRLDATEPDPEDELAVAFKRVVDVRGDVLGILAGTKQVRIDRRKLRPAEKVNVPAAPTPAADPPSAPAETKAERSGTSPAAAVADRGANAVTAPIASLAVANPPTVQNDVQRKGAGAALPVQRKAKPGAAPPPDTVASKGFQGGGGPLPHIETIQRSFGRHDVTDVRAHQGPATQQAAAELGAEAYASGRDVGFAMPPDLHTASHEAAHVVQQRFGVQLMGGIDGGADDPYERHADQVAEEVVAGRSAEALLDRMAGSGSADRGAVQRSPPSGAGAAHAHEDDRVPARGDYFVERTADGSYVFVFNTFDRRAWAEPVFTGLRYYMQQVFPGVGDHAIRSVFTDLKVRFDSHDAGAFPDDKRYELRIHGKLHRDVIAWMATHHPELAPHEPKQGGAGLHAGDGGADASHHAAHSGQPQKTSPHATTMTAEGGKTGAHPADKVSADVEHTRALYERLRKAFPDVIELGSRSTWPEFLAYVSDHAAELQKLLHDSGRAANPDDLRKLLAQFRAHQDVKDGDSGGDVDGHANGKLAGSEAGTKDGDVRTTQDGGIKDGSIYGEPGGDAHGWHRWIPRGQLLLQPTQPTYVAGSSVQTELAWDLSVHPEAGQILLPNHCTYAWTVHGGGKLIDSGGRSVLADDRRADLRLGKEPGTYTIEVTATSKHFRADRHRFSSRVAVRAISEQAFDRAAFDETQVNEPDATFSRDDHGALHVKPGQTARTPQEEIGTLDMTRGGVDALAAQGKITGSDHDVAVSQIEKQREALVEIQANVKDGTPYLVRGTFVSREDSSRTPLRLMMHVLRRGESGGVARYELILHDTTFGNATQHPGRAAWRLDHDSPAAVYRRLEGEALEEMAEHFHAHNDYPNGTVHLAAPRLAGDGVWEKTLDTENGRKTAKKILGTAALIGGAAMLIVPGGSVVATGLMVVTSAAGIANVALDVEHRMAQEGGLKLDRRLAMDVLQVAAISLPFGTLTRTFAGAKIVSQGKYLLCMTGLDVAQGFVIATTAKQQLDVIEANTAVELAGATSDEQRQAIHAERDRRAAEVIGGAVVNSGFLLVSLGHGIKQTIAVTRVGGRFTVREPVRELVKQGREPMEQALSTDTFEHDGQRVQLTSEERRYLEHEIAAPQAQPTAPTSSATDPHTKAAGDVNSREIALDERRERQSHEGAAAHVPGSHFVGAGANRPDITLPSVQRHAESAALMLNNAAAAVKVRGADVAPFFNPLHNGDVSIAVPGAGAVRVKFELMEAGEDVARHNYKKGEAVCTVFISGKARDADVARAIAHELAEIQAMASGVATERPAMQAGSVSEGLDPHDIGRKAEIEVLLYQAERAPEGTGTDQAAELRALIQHLGFDAKTIGTDARAKRILGEDEVVRVDEILNKPRIAIKKGKYKATGEIVGQSWEFVVKAELPNGKQHVIATGSIELIPSPTEPGKLVPKDGQTLDFMIDNVVGMDHRESRIKLEGAERLTDYIVNEAVEQFTQKFQVAPEMGGLLALDNKARFQHAYAEIVRANPNITPEAAADAAILQIPYGAARARAGYDVKAQASGSALILTGDPPRWAEVPDRITAIATPRKK